MIGPIGHPGTNAVSDLLNRANLGRQEQETGHHIRIHGFFREEKKRKKYLLLFLFSVCCGKVKEEEEPLIFFPEEEKKKKVWQGPGQV